MNRDTRAIANRLLMFGLIIIVISLLSATLNPAFDDISNETDALADTTQAQSGLGYVEAAWDYKAFIGLMLGVAMLLASALFESRRNP